MRSVYPADELLRYLREWLIPEQSHRDIPDSQTVDILSRKVTPQLSMRTADVAKLDQHYENEKQKATKEAVAIPEQLEDDGIIHRHKKQDLRLMNT